MASNKYEAFTIETVNRKDIDGAEYNPRKISESARKKLKKSLKEHGMVMPIVVNRRSMTIVSGHQRVFLLDDILRSDDYPMQVAMIDVDEKEEAVLNVSLNNQSLMGEWDVFALQDIKEMFPDIDYQDMGFDLSDIEVMGLEKEQEEALRGLENQAVYIDPMQEAKRAAKQQPMEEEGPQPLGAEDFRRMKAEQREKEKERTADKHELSDLDYVLQVVFPNNHEKRDFMRKIRKDPKEKYVKSTVLLDIYNHVYDISVFGGDA
jgi:hypothetical protein